MRLTKSTLTAAALTVGVVSAALATERFPPLKRVDVLDVTIAGTPSVSTITGTRISFAPGQPTPLHLHPVPVVGVVTLGSFLFQIEGQPAKTLHVGDAFYEPANVRISKFDNASSSTAGEITAFYLADRPDRPLIKLLER